MIIYVSRQHIQYLIFFFIQRSKNLISNMNSLCYYLFSYFLYIRFNQRTQYCQLSKRLLVQWWNKFHEFDFQLSFFSFLYHSFFHNHYFYYDLKKNIKNITYILRIWSQWDFLSQNCHVWIRHIYIQINERERNYYFPKFFTNDSSTHILMLWIEKCSHSIMHSFKQFF